MQAERLSLIHIYMNLFAEISDASGSNLLSRNLNAVQPVRPGEDFKQHQTDDHVQYLLALESAGHQLEQDQELSLIHILPVYAHQAGVLRLR